MGGSFCSLLVPLPFWTQQSSCLRENGLIAHGDGPIHFYPGHHGSPPCYTHGMGGCEARSVDRLLLCLFPTQRSLSGVRPVCRSIRHEVRQDFNDVLQLEDFNDSELLRVHRTMQYVTCGSAAALTALPPHLCDMVSSAQSTSGEHALLITGESGAGKTKAVEQHPAARGPGWRSDAAEHELFEVRKSIVVYAGNAVPASVGDVLYKHLQAEFGISGSSSPRAAAQCHSQKFLRSGKRLTGVLSRYGSRSSQGVAWVTFGARGTWGICRSSVQDGLDEGPSSIVALNNLRALPGALSGRVDQLTEPVLLIFRFKSRVRETCSALLD